MESIQDNSPGPVRVRLLTDDLSFDTIKSAIYAQARSLWEKNPPPRTPELASKLLLSKDLFEILNRRLVFTRPARVDDRSSTNDLPHFITPYGNLEVEAMDEGIDEPFSFVIA
jgi:hypothetical protein